MENFTLIVTEKPNAAKRIAYALDYQGNPKCFRKNGVPYFVAQRDKKLVVIPTIGHLYTIVHERGNRDYYPVFNFKWVPRHLAERRAKSIRNWIEAFSELSQDADEFISACDYDIEGSLIGYFVLKYACDNNVVSAKRMKFSTLMKSDLEKAYEEPLSHLDFALIDAGRTRHELDWLYGVNLSRALTLAVNNWSGKYSTLSTGRVQGPTLHFLASREKAIRSFVPVPYWEIHVQIEIKDLSIEAEYELKKIGTRAEADALVRECKNKTGNVTKIVKKEVDQKPPLPFNLGMLQREAYRLFGYNPRHTLSIAQRLYISALISYPRTNSQKLPPIIDYRKTISYLERQSEYKELAQKLLAIKELKPREGNKEDTAHPAVYPTGNLPEKSLTAPEKKVWDLIVRRFMAVFGDDALKESLKVQLEVTNHTFFLRGRRLLKEGWMKYYKPYMHFEEIILPSIKQGEKVRFRNVMRKDKFTCSPPRYNPCSVLKKMEELGIGTKATRADIIQTLYKRGYIRDESIVVTELGFDVIDVLCKYASIVISSKLTQELEDKLERIQNGTMNSKNVLVEFVEKLKPQLEQFKENEVIIGKTLSIAKIKAQTQERTVGQCPTCVKGKLAIIYSKKTRKRFVGCTNYFKGLCTTSFPLPQCGTVKPAKSNCRACGWPNVLVWFRSKRPRKLCFNPDCSLKEKRGEKNKVLCL
jgi:DNA topoisomerase-1